MRIFYLFNLIFLTALLTFQPGAVKISDRGVFFSLSSAAHAQEAPDSLESDLDFEDEMETGIDISDPLEPVNRIFFHFNDKLYFWALKPVAQVYGSAIPKDFRICIRNAFHNLLAPVRIVNNALQGKFENSGIELSRFVINTTAGVAGFGDPAKDVFDLQVKDEDLGQTLAVYGVGNGIYFCWPFLGPSTMRDTVGLAGDAFLSPLYYLYHDDEGAGIAAYALTSINNTSLVIGDYEAFKEASFDPYISLRDAYIQHRDSKVKDLNKSESVY